MLTKLRYQGLIFLTLMIFIQCQNEEENIQTKWKEFAQIGYNVLQNGRIISKPVVQQMPIDQIQLPELQQDDTNPKETKYVAHGDILISVEEIELLKAKRSKRKIIAETNYFGDPNRWPRGVVPYVFTPNIDYRVKQNVLAAAQHWHQRTCIRFEPYDRQRHRNIAGIITIEDTGSGCATFVGYRSASSGLPSSYSVYLPLTCPLGSAIHELGHVIGFYHEMARPDRDQEINLYFNLMSNTEATQYDIMPNPMSGFYGQPYDLGSIMHYFPTSVMSARDNRRGFLMGQRVGLSFLDSQLANLAYHCSDHCNNNLACENEGYLDQYCHCICPEGFFGDRCNLLQGFLSTTRVFPSTNNSLIPTEIEEPETASITSTETTTTIETSTTTGIQWLAWSHWSNCSESCGSGIRVRTRLCSNTSIDGSADPCASLGGESFEIEACQNSNCNQTDIVVSCTFDLPDEKCPLNNLNDWRIQQQSLSDQIRPISDHTRGDGKYLLIIGNGTRSLKSQQLQLGPLIHSTSSHEKHHCLQFWYSAYGQGQGKLTIIRSKHNDNENDELFMSNKKDQDTHWRQIQRTISNDDDYELIFTYQSSSTEYNHMAIDDISIISGACPQSRRKRRQTSSGCSTIIDLTATNRATSITSPNYPNLYPPNMQCYYYIRAPTLARIKLQFTDFNLPTAFSNGCDDTLEIRYYHLGQPGPKYCGGGANSNNLRFLSTNNYIMVILRTNRNNAGRGFRAEVNLAQ